MLTSDGKTIVFVADPTHGVARKRRTVLARPPRVGDQLGGYRLCVEIGRGGMATVYLAQVPGRSGLHRFVALKCIRSDLARDPKLVEMFLDEAQIASSIHHANVCSVLDFDEHHGVYYLAMEYLSGQTLTAIGRQVAKQPERWEPERLSGIVARILENACEGLHAAHEIRNARGEPMGVVHRDVSPDNMFVTYDGTVKIVDFGIAYFAEQSHKTRTGILKGKCCYLSPEVLAGDKPDRRADIWGLGVVAWELLTQRRLFDQANDPAILRAICDMEIPAPSTVRPGIPPLLDEIVLRALQRNPAKRYQTARELGRLLSRFLVEHRLVVGLAETAEFMQALFPEGPACSRQLLNVAEQLEESAEATLFGSIGDDVEPAEPAPGDTGTVVNSKAAQKLARLCVRDDLPDADRTERSNIPLWWKQTGLLLPIAAASLFLIACSVFAMGLGSKADASPKPAEGSAITAAAPVPAPSPPPAMVAPASHQPALTGYAIEAQPMGSDDSGALLLRVRVVPGP